MSSSTDVDPYGCIGDEDKPEGLQRTRTLHIVAKMEDRLDPACPRQQCLLLMLCERFVVLRHFHRQAEILLLTRRQRSRNRMPERPAQAQRSLVREGRRLIP